ncbi:MAG: CotH kinase family protein [Ignavibacteriales bacterium]|nr:CotH kinase family protein [Ignavibacteriales bacterium]MCB9259157.1 CotH kinase family protein [Ignavibacteriales bacterium]
MTNQKYFIVSILFLMAIISCTDSINESTNEDNNQTEELDISDWSETTHSKSASPNYDIVFPQDKVNRIDIKISSDDWQTMLDDMISKYGTFGSNTGGGPPMMEESSDNPVYVPCSLYFNNIQWYKVGIRFKGNSSLRTSWQKGIWKIPLRLNFDKFEDIYPQINNQRFYGFKELSLSSCYDDKSLIREKVVPEIFRDMGVPAPQTSFCRIYIDYGEGEKYFGLYTIVEIVEDTMIEDQFTETDGNVYKPEGNGASFASNAFNLSYFEKKNNEETDWSDVESLFDALQSEQRINNPAEWENSLEKVFNVNGFLKWLAVNSTIQNWDTYGKMTHNYYLYNDPKNNWLTWIPWDNNEALQSGKMGGAISISCDEVNDNWPLIRYLLDDEEYLQKYKIYLAQVVESAFEPSKMTTKYQYYQSLIREYAIGENGEQAGYTFLSNDSDFDSAILDLIAHVNNRNDAVKNYIN